MKTIWKFPFPIEDHFKIEMPKDAVILTVQMQNGKACIWAIVNPNEEKEDKYFRLFGTGQPNLLHYYKYIGTFQMEQGTLVWHLFVAERNYDNSNL